MNFETFLDDSYMHYCETLSNPGIAFSYKLSIISSLISKYSIGFFDLLSLFPR